MKILNLLILLCLTQIMFGQTHKTFVKSFNTYQNAKSAAKAVENITQKPNWIDTIHN